MYENWEPPEFMYYDREGNGLAIDLENPEDAERFTQLWSHEYRIVVQEHVGDVFVSTVFLPIDHGWGNGPPILFETMVFGYDHRPFWRRWWDAFRGDEDWADREYQWRYTTEAVARKGHGMILDAVEQRKLRGFEMNYEELYDPR